MLLHGVKDSEFEIFHGDTLLNEWDLFRDLIPAKKPLFDAIVGLHEFSKLRLVHFDDSKQADEITVVSPPYILDFAKGYVACARDFSEEVFRSLEIVCVA